MPEKKLEHNEHFFTVDGKKVGSLKELVAVLESMDDASYAHHVTGQKNDFSDWILNCFNEKELADKLKAVKSKEDAVKLINEKIENNKKKDADLISEEKKENLSENKKVNASEAKKEVDNMADKNQDVKTSLSESQLFQTLDGSVAAMRALDKDFKIIFQNAKMSELTGVSKESAIGMKCYDELKGPACHNEKCTLVRVLKGDAKIEGEIEKELPDGRKIMTKLLAVPLKDESGKVIGVIESFADVSDIKKKEEAALGLLQTASDEANTTAASTEELSASAEQVNSSMQQVSSTIQEIAKGAQELSKSASAAADKSKKTQDSSTKGAQAAQSVKEKMTTIRDTTKTGAEKVKALGEKSKKIGEIVETIKGISEQTNLLALNAAIEAARAGDAGRGFAVVADEVRKLAEESKKATGQISELIIGIQEEIKGSVENMNENTKQVDEGVQAVTQALSSFEEIPALVQQVDKSISDISAVAEENAAGAEEVSASIQQVTSSMQTVAETAQNLSVGAEKLKQLIGKSKKDIKEK